MSHAMRVYSIDDLHDQLDKLRDAVEESNAKLQESNTTLEEGQQTLESIAELAREWNEKLESIDERLESITESARDLLSDLKATASAHSIPFGEAALRLLALTYIAVAGCIWATDIIFGVRLYGLGRTAIEFAIGILLSVFSR